MKKLILSFAVMLSMPTQQLFAQFRIEDFTKLHSLDGVWRTERKTGVLYEVWKIENDSTMKGRTYRVANKDTTKLESVVLAFHSGVITYSPITAYQNNQQPVVFKLADITGDTYNFENKAHDFPQKISYILPKNDSLSASISGPTPNGPKTIQYNYERYLGKPEK